MFAPRPHIVRAKSGTLDVSDGYDKQILLWRDSVVQQGSSEQQAYRELQAVQQYIDYLDGTSWWGEGRPDYRSSYVDNYLADQRLEALSSLSSIRPSMSISTSIDQYKAQGEVVHKYIQHTWVNQDLDLELVKWIDHSLFGTGFWKMVCYWPGIFEISSHGLDEVIPVGMRDDIQTAMAVVFRQYQPLSYFFEKFGRDKSEGLERYAVKLTGSLKAERYSRPGDIPEYVWNPMSPAMKRRMSLRRGPQPPNIFGYSPFHTVELMEIYTDDWSFNDEDHDKLVKHPDLDCVEHNYHYIVPPKCRLFPRKRLVVFGGDRVMYDGPSPFWHGLYPFIMLQLNPCVWNPGGISKYRNLVSLNKSINRIGAGVDESVMQALNATLIGKRGAIDPVSWERLMPGKPGQKVLMNPSGDPTRDLRRMDPPIIPAYVAEFLRYLVDTIKKRSGSLDIMGLSRKKQVPGGDTIENMRDSLSSPFQLESRYVEAGIKRAAIQATSDVFQFVNLERRIQVLGQDGQTFEDYTPPLRIMAARSSPQEDHWKKFGVQIAPGSSHGTSKFQKKQEAFVMYKSNALSLHGLYRQLETNEDAEQNIKEMKAEHEAGVGMIKPSKQSPRMTRNQRTGSPI